jgi:hypothetical protein
MMAVQSDCYPGQTLLFLIALSVNAALKVIMEVPVFFLWDIILFFVVAALSAAAPVVHFYS